jgi:hypothetical protein
MKTVPVFLTLVAFLSGCAGLSTKYPLSDEAVRVTPSLEGAWRCGSSERDHQQVKIHWLSADKVYAADSAPKNTNPPTKSQTLDFKVFKAKEPGMYVLQTTSRSEDTGYALALLEVRSRAEVVIHHEVNRQKFVEHASANKLLVEAMTAIGVGTKPLVDYRFVHENKASGESGVVVESAAAQTTAFMRRVDKSIFHADKATTCRR